MEKNGRKSRKKEARKFVKRMSKTPRVFDNATDQYFYEWWTIACGCFIVLLLVALFYNAVIGASGLALVSYLGVVLKVGCVLFLAGGLPLLIFVCFSPEERVRMTTSTVSSSFGSSMTSKKINRLQFKQPADETQDVVAADVLSAVLLCGDHDRLMVSIVSNGEFDKNFKVLIIKVQSKRIYSCVIKPRTNPVLHAYVRKNYFTDITPIANNVPETILSGTLVYSLKKIREIFILQTSHGCYLAKDKPKLVRRSASHYDLTHELVGFRLTQPVMVDEFRQPVGLEAYGTLGVYLDKINQNIKKEFYRLGGIAFNYHRESDSLIYSGKLESDLELGELHITLCN